MSDIVDRLRDQGRDAFAKQYSLGMWKLCAEAADEIERLRSDIDVMRTDCIYAEDQWARTKANLADYRAGKFKPKSEEQS
jgi:hypothetical protein